ncbi:hypothetical protein HOP50_01g02660 [Chloropicon primus]|uniref:Uncharacterized protein n=1 Tax=Chloropicon primus TaxID=1764295 RepID=A0A5B8MBF6_9CHLO|nr:hypothetical protein A3770_01p02760 [Chloropicon primus]UPQ96975.1 hypothetical protein HOP50_01g02660 [Chloropicon primus]|eukprot:QDZ17758.1 hypothetical protein A3770_01p02760 [Chloropicon primus]
MEEEPESAPEVTEPEADVVDEQKSPPRQHTPEKSNYLSKTVVQPKPVTDAQTHQGTECSSVIKAFSPGSFAGIRALPTNIHPDFRQESLMQTLENTKEEKSGKTSPTRASPVSRLARDKGSNSTRVPKGQRRRQKYGGMPQTFTSYEYMSDPVQDKLAKRREEINKGKEKWLSPDDFKTHKSRGLLNRHTYSMSPYELLQEAAKRESVDTKQKILHGPVRAGGCVNQAQQAKIRLKELLKSLIRLLKRDWPQATIDAFVDDTGYVVVSYLKEGMSLKHVNAYMNRFAKLNATVYEFKLKKDATRWGVTNEEMENTFFVFCPPWIHSKPQLSKRLHGVKAKHDTSHELALDSGRIPFGPQSASGNSIQIHVRNLAYAFKT